MLSQGGPDPGTGPPGPAAPRTISGGGGCGRSMAQLPHQPRQPHRSPALVSR